MRPEGKRWRAVRRGGGMVAVAAAFAGTALAGLTSQAQTPPASGARSDVRESRDCVPARDIRSTRIRSASVIDFHLRNGEVLRNDLGERCGGLDPPDAVTYQRSSPNLCRGDPITVLERPTLIPGASCPLADFRLLSAEERAAAKRGEPIPGREETTD